LAVAHSLPLDAVMFFVVLGALAAVCIIGRLVAEACAAEDLLEAEMRAMQSKRVHWRPW
jgi:hypothetical protein